MPYTIITNPSRLLSGSKKNCRVCLLSIDQVPYVSKLSHSTKRHRYYYHIPCAQKVGLVDREDDNETIEDNQNVEISA